MLNAVYDGTVLATSRRPDIAMPIKPFTNPICISFAIEFSISTVGGYWGEGGGGVPNMIISCKNQNSLRLLRAVPETIVLESLDSPFGRVVNSALKPGPPESN